MARSPYQKEYRVTETVDEKGRVRSDYVYIGARYGFVLPTAQVKAELKRCRLLVLGGWACFLLGLLFRSTGTETFYSALCFLFTALPLGMLTELLLSAPRNGESMEHKQADRMAEGFRPRALFTALLPLIALLGEAANLLRPDKTLLFPGDLIFSLAAAALSALGWLLLRRSDRFLTRKQ